MTLCKTLWLAARPMAKIIMCLTMIFLLICCDRDIALFEKTEEGSVVFRCKTTTYRLPKGKEETVPNTSVLSQGIFSAIFQLCFGLARYGVN